ncbi:tape measure protein [Flavobacterium sp.]
MNNQIEFILKLKNMMGGELSKLGSTSQSTFSKMAKNVENVSQRNKVLGSTFNELGRQYNKVEDAIKNSTIPARLAQARKELAELYKTERGKGAPASSGKSGGSGIGINGVAIGSMLGGIYTKALSLISEGAGTIIEQSMKKETAISGLTTFLGAKGANEAYKNIRSDATPFDLDALLEVNRALISSGENAINARSTSLDLANAVSAVGGGNEKLVRMAVNMQQIKNVGKATAMDIKQFGMAGINIYEMLARSTGKNVSQLKEMDVTYEMLQKSLAMSRGKGGMYQGAMEVKSNTKEGKWGTMKDGFLAGASDIGDAFSPIINKLLDVGVRFAGSIGPALQMAQPYIESFANGFSLVLDFITGATTATGGWSDYLAIATDFVSKLWVFIKNIGIKLWEFVSSIIEFVKNSEILKDVFRFIGWIFEKVYGIVGSLLSGIIWLWENIIKPILTAVDAVYKWIKGDDGKSVNITSSKKIVALPKKNDSIFETSKMSSSNDTAGRSAGESVVGGGPKTINITVGKFFDNLQFTTMNTQESAAEMEKIMMEVLARVVYNGAKMV